MLTIYRASAGAGKTHKLTGEYLALLFAEAKDAYRHILAVTFTNKATDEMKSRIVEELYALASGGKSGYVDLLCGAGRTTEEEVRSRAAKILADILHDYSAFNISTIDRFFQQTMRAFAREIGLQGGYEIEMDSTAVLSAAVDAMMANLDKAENKALLGWLIMFAENKMTENGKWNFRRDIMKLGEELFNESYRAAGDEAKADISNKNVLEEYRNAVFSVIRSTEAEARRLGEEGENIIKQYGLRATDFKWGRTSPMLKFGRMTRGEVEEPTERFIGFADNPEGLYTASKTSPEIKEAILRAFSGGLNDCIKRVISFHEDLTTYNTAKAIAQNSYTLGILTDISREIAAYRREKNVMMIADTTELLGKVIGGSDAPFIYEKTGTRVDHFMIDEFQDTSGMQWRNFRPLLEESLSRGKANLIVGDVKQSIYRFRNSDWTLLEGQVQEDFRRDEVREETLADNWRSARNIVEFNNAVFTALPAVLQGIYNDKLLSSSLSDTQRKAYSGKIVSVYRGSCQQVPPPFLGKDGHVRVEFLDKDGWMDASLERLPGVIEQLQDKGYEPRDIAVLVRKNKEGAMVADRLLTYKKEHPDSPYRYDIISGDSLFISNSPAIRFIVAVLRHLEKPEDEFCRQLMKYAYRVMKITSESDDVFSVDTSAAAFPEETLSRLKALSHRSLYELTEGITHLFSGDIRESEQVFIRAFLDMVSEFARKGSADTGRFLEWWDETGSGKTITTPDDQNAIRIITIHKSKGLGFKAVVIPFADWNADNSSVILWCRPKVAPFDRLHLVPVNYTKELPNTIFADDYFHERLHAFVDNLNALYVAFTRAKEELIVFAPKTDSVGTMAGALRKALGTNEHATADDVPLIPLSESFSGDVFELGSDWHPSCQSPRENATEEIAMKPVAAVSPDERLQLRLHGKGFFFDDTRRRRGTLMHEVLSRIRTRGDIPAAVESYHLSGVISTDEATTLTSRLNSLLSTPEVAPWYDGSSRVLNEVDILFGKEGISRRPDRVMITGDRVVVVDYKFGEQQEKRHRSQVRDYINLIRRMGYSNVEGHIWYVALGIRLTIDG